MISINTFRHTLKNGLIAYHEQKENGMHQVTIRDSDGVYYSGCTRATGAEAHKYIEMIAGEVI